MSVRRTSMAKRAKPDRNRGAVGRALLGALTCALACALAACASSPPMRFYVLTPAAASAVGGGGSDAASGELRVSRVSLPGELDRPQIVRGLAGNELQIAEQDRWAGPLDEMIRRVLNENLARASGASAGAGAGPPRSLSLEIESLMPRSDCSVEVRAAWAVGAARGHVAFRTAGSAGACNTSDVPAALSAALGELSGRLRAELANGARPETPPG